MTSAPAGTAPANCNFAVYDVQGQVLELAVYIDGAVLNVVVHIVLLKFKKGAASCEAALRMFLAQSLVHNVEEDVVAELHGELLQRRSR